MKKSLAVITLAMVAALALCLVGCGGSEKAAHYYQVQKILSMDNTSDIVKVL